MRDGPLRRAVKALARTRYLFDLRLQRALLRRRGQLPWELGGECRHCAACCEAPAIQVPRVVLAWSFLRRPLLAWQRAVNGFEHLRTLPRERLLVFRCTHFDPATRGCDSYDSRPGMCRDYPRLLLHAAAPEFLPGCGYRAVARNAAGLRAALDRLPLDEERRRKLDEGLRLD